MARRDFNSETNNQDVLPSFNNKIYSHKIPSPTTNIPVNVPTRVHRISTVTPTKIITHFTKNYEVGDDTDSEDDNDNENKNNQGSNITSMASIRHQNSILQTVLDTYTSSDSDDSDCAEESGIISDDENNIEIHASLSPEQQQKIQEQKVFRKNIFKYCEESVSDKSKSDLLFQKISENLNEKKSDLLLNNLSMTENISKFFNIRELNWIKKVVIINNNIPQISFDIFPESLTHLVLTNNNIIEFRTNRHCPNIEHLNLSHNNLSSFYNVDNKVFPSLKRLNISHNKLVGSLTNSLKIKDLKTLISLNVSYNKLGCIEYAYLDNRIEVLQCEHNDLNKVSIMSNSLISIYLGHNPQLRKLTLLTQNISTINLCGGEFSNLDSSSFNMLINKVCRIDIDERYKNLLENEKVTKIDSGEIGSTSKFAPINTKFFPGNKFESNKSTYAGNYNDKPGYKPYNPHDGRHNHTNESRYFNARGGYWQKNSHNSNHGVWRNGVRVIENPTEEQINFYIEKTIQNYANAIKQKCTTDMNQLLDETFVFPQKNTYII